MHTQLIIVFEVSSKFYDKKVLNGDGQHSLNVTVFLYPAPYLGQAKTKYGKYKGQWDIGRWYSVVFSRGKLGNK